MAASAKSKAELEQIALAMMMMAGGEGTSPPPPAELVGVKTRSSSSRSSLNNNNRRGQDHNHQEPVSGNYLNKNTRSTRRSLTIKQQPGSPEENNEYSEDYVDNNATNMAIVAAEEDEEEDHLAPNPSHEMMEDEEDESATDLVIKQEETDEAIICAINPLSIQSSPSPGSPAGSLQSTNSGSGSIAGGGGGGGGAGVGNVMGGGNNNEDCIYMSASRRIFRPEFKQKVMDAFANDPDCVGNQRATARKFGIHRRQVQKWLQQLSTGELTFKDSSQQQQQDLGDNEDSYPEPTKLTSSKLVRSSQGNLPTRNGNGTGKVLTRRSLGGGNIIIRSNPNQQQKSSINSIGRASDPTSRANRSAARNRGKSMPLKGGSKSGSHYVPTITVKPAPSSTATSSGLNLTKSGKLNGKSSATSTSTSYAYYNDSNGTNGNSSNGNNMFMNMSTLLASAAAAGNLTMPLSLDPNPRNYSPRDHSPINNNGRGSPAHSAGGSSGGSHHSSNLQNALLLVDELNFLYPYSDFSLLRKALLKEEVSLEKLAHPLMRGNKSTEFRVNGNGLNSDLTQGLRELRRAAALSPSPAKSTSSQQEYNTQQTLDMIRQQQEYLKLLQLSGIGGSSSDLTNGLNLADLTNNGNGRIPAWFNPLAAAAAAGLPIPSTSGGKFGNGGTFNGGNSGENSRRSIAKQEPNDNHRFASPRVPPVVNSNKAKTVAAALAATRVVQSTSSSQQLHGRNFQQNGRQSQAQRNAQRRKAANGRQAAAASAARGQNVTMDDDSFDPTSMLEVVTNIPSPSNSPRTNANSNQYGYNNNHHRKNGGTSGNNDYQSSMGMDLSTTSANASSSSNSTTTTSSSSTRLISKAMNKEYSFLSELGLIRKSPEIVTTTTNSTTGKNGYGHGHGHTASLESFVENILPPRQRSPRAASSSTSSSSPPAADLSDSDKTKSMVIDAFMCDPETSGDARAVARKFGLNVRVVMKWLKEAPVKSSPPANDMHHDNDHGRVNGGDGIVDDEEGEYLHQAQRLHKGMMLNESNNNSPGSNGGTGVNKRKNSKPNQICDFSAEDDMGMNGALDMVVPIKKRRVSSPSPTSQDA